jgi:hypothetical protein
MNRRATPRCPAKGLSAGFSRRREGSPTIHGRAQAGSQRVRQCPNVVWFDLGGLCLVFYSDVPYLI